MERGAPARQRADRPALLIAQPPDVDAGEVTDKGQLNRLAVVSRRADLVQRPYADPPPADVVAPEPTR